MTDKKESKYIYLHNKKYNITYVYENYPYWSKENKRSQAKRICIGKIDKITGDIVPTGKNKHALPKESFISKRSFYGATYLLNSIGQKLGIIDDLKHCFPDDYQQILSIVFYMILEDKNPLSRFEKWGSLHHHPCGHNISSQRSSELFASITESAKTKFFQLQGKRRAENEYWAYDVTSISSYSQTLKQIQYGYNKEHDKLPQLNLALVYGEESGLPFYYRRLAGNIPDVITVKNLVSDLKTYGFDRVKLVGDRVMSSEDNINELYKEGYKFLLSTDNRKKMIRFYIDEAKKTIHSFDCFDPNFKYKGYTITSFWNYKQARPYKKDTLKDKKRIYVHVYYNEEKYIEESQQLDAKLAILREELLIGNIVESNESLYKKYFDVRKRSKGKNRVKAKDDVIQECKKYYGYFVLLSNDIKDTWEALTLYRMKDVVEKAFGNFKERLNMRRLLVSSERSLEGKLFVAFVALIFLSYVHKQMSIKKLYKDYTMYELFDKLDVIECFEHVGKKLRVGEMVEKQIKLYKAMEVKIP